MTATTGCGCGGSTDAGYVTAATTVPAAAGERVRYYPRQLVSAADLTQDQLYFREKARRHNRMLHGWGIVCGAEVRVSSKPGCVDVNVGYLLGPYGDEIVIDDVITVDLAAQNADGDAANGCAPPDPWCADVRAFRPAGATVYLAIAYAEFACRPVQAAVSGCGCGCEDTVCEYSRWRDSFRIRVLDALPDTYPAQLVPPSPAVAFSCRSTFGRNNAYLAAQLQHEGGDLPAPAVQQDCDCPQCTPCPTSPWVILADLKVNGEEIAIDCDAHRRYVASFRDFFYTCRSERTVPQGHGLLDLFRRSTLDRFKERLDDLPGAMLAEPAHGLSVDIDADTPLGKRLAARSVADVALTSRDVFVAEMTVGARAENRAVVAEKAAQVWEKAVRAKNLAEGSPQGLALEGGGV